MCSNIEAKPSAGTIAEGKDVIDEAQEMMASIDAVIAVYSLFQTPGPNPIQIVQVFDSCEVAKVPLSKEALAHRFLARGLHLLTFEDYHNFLAMVSDKSESHEEMLSGGVAIERLKTLVSDLVETALLRMVSSKISTVAIAAKPIADSEEKKSIADFVRELRKGKADGLIVVPVPIDILEVCVDPTCDAVTVCSALDLHDRYRAGDGRRRAGQVDAVPV